jgi:ketosteroid isomerase-like protein
MSLLKTYIDGLKKGDAEQVASVFTEDAVFNDKAPEAMGMDAIVLQGKVAIQENFTGLLANGGLTIEDVAFCGNAVRYDIVIAEGLVVKALGLATETDGLISHYEVEAPAS